MTSISTTFISITAARASRCRTALSVRRSTGASLRARKPATARVAPSGLTPGSSTRHSDASRPPKLPVPDGNIPPGASSMTSITSIPSGSTAFSRSRTSAAACRLVSARLRYSASLATPVGAPPAYEIFGCGVNPAEYAIGSPALRTPRSKARATSLWLAKRIFPRLAYRTTRRWTAGLAGDLGAGSVTLPPAHHGKQALPIQALPGGPHLDFRTHSGTYPAFITRSPAAIFHLGRALGSDGVLPVLPQPVAVKTRVQVIPGEHLTVITFARSVPCNIHRLRGQRRFGAASSLLEREALAPPVDPGAGPPRCQDHGGDPAVPARQQALDERGLPVVIPEADRLGVAAGRAH